MNMLTSKTLILTFHQLLLLLCKREIDGLVLPDEISELSADEKELKEAFGELITDRYIIPGEDGSYRISQELEAILDVMSQASHSYVIYEESNKFPPCYIYRINLQAVCLRLDYHRKGLIKLELTDFEDKISELRDGSFLKMVIQCFRTGQTEPKRIVTNDSLKTDLIDILLEV